MSDAPVDEAALSELRSIMGEEFDLLVDVFVSDSAKRLDDIEQAIKDGNAESLRTTAHGFKGSALNISAARLTSLCRELEDMGRNRELADATGKLEMVRQEYETVKTYLLAL